jgi:hypothetical protein
VRADTTLSRHNHVKRRTLTIDDLWARLLVDQQSAWEQLSGVVSRCDQVRPELAMRRVAEVLSLYEDSQAAFARGLLRLSAPAETLRHFENLVSGSYESLCDLLASVFGRQPNATPTREIGHRVEVEYAAKAGHGTAGATGRGAWGNLNEVWLRTESASTRERILRLRQELLSHPLVSGKMTARKR